VFAFINRYDSGRNLALAEARHLPLDYFEELPKCSN
jgi:hypothetical protein